MVKRTSGALFLSLRIDRTTSLSVSNQLCAALREIILNGALDAEQRLPATRTLAEDLGVSRTTVIDVFERLTAEGLIEARTGSGTYVSPALRKDRPRPAGDSCERLVRDSCKPRLSRSIGRAINQFSSRIEHGEPRAFTTALPAFDAFPVARWSRQMAKHWRAHRDIVLGYGDPQGYFPLRRAIASHLRVNRGVDCEPEQVYIVGGAQQAFHLIGAVLLNPGDKVWFENPGATGARNALIACGARLVPVPIDGSGLMVDVGLRTAPEFRLAFVTPSHQHPLGATMGLERRFALLNAAEKANAMIIEDDYDGEFCYSGQPMPTLKSVDVAGRVIYVGTFSKTLFPALRLGYFVAPPSMVDTFDQVTHAFLQGVPSNPQAVVADFMNEGYFAAHIRRMRKIYAERHQVFRESAKTHLAGLLDVAPTDTGMNTVGYLAAHLSESAAAAAADEQGITVAPISRYCLEPVKAKGFVLGFSGIRPDAIVAGVQALRSVLTRLPRRPDIPG